jgi:protein-disulfide isomerase
MTGHFRRALTLAVALALVGAAPHAGQQTAPDYQALKKEIESLKAQQQAQQKQIDELKARISTPAPPAAAGPVQPVAITLDLDTVAIRGSESARVMLVETGDFECPFCGRHFRQTAPQIEKEYVETGKIRHAVLNYPLVKHVNAFKASEAAACAGDQGKYWQMYDRLFSNQTLLALRQLPAHAAALGLQADVFRTCLDSGKHATEIRNQMSVAQRAGVTGTPTFFLGVIEPKSRTLKATSRIVGAKPLSVFEGAIDSLIALAGSK